MYVMHNLFCPKSNWQRTKRAAPGVNDACTLIYRATIDKMNRQVITHKLKIMVFQVQLVAIAILMLLKSASHFGKAKLMILWYHYVTN